MYFYFLSNAASLACTVPIFGMVVSVACFPLAPPPELEAEAVDVVVVVLCCDGVG